MPGFVDCHVHAGGGRKAPDAEYVYKLWLAHGVTTVRGVPAGPLDWTLRERGRSARNEITAPRIVVYARPGHGDGWLGGPITTPEKAREWVTWVAGKGADGLKLFAEDPEIDEGADRPRPRAQARHHRAPRADRPRADEPARRRPPRPAAARNTSTAFSTRCSPSTSVQPYPPDYNYNDEAHRFAPGREGSGTRSHPRGSNRGTT